MIRLYHCPHARSARVLWLLEELGVPYDLVKLDFTPERLKSPDYLKIHPLGKVPAIVDGDLTLFESGAIVEYIVERYGEGRLAPPPGSAERAAFLQWLHFGEATLLPPLGDIAQHTIFRPEAERIPAVVADARQRAAAVLALLERVLSERAYLAGSDFTAADIMTGYGLHLTKLLGLLTPDQPNIQAYLGRLAERPAFRKAFA
jgi:glutathione S-transferase